MTTRIKFNADEIKEMVRFEIFRGSGLKWEGEIIIEYTLDGSMIAELKREAQ
jgi:hypothetical protein